MTFKCKWPVDTKWVDIEARWGFHAAEEFVKSRFEHQVMTLASMCMTEYQDSLFEVDVMTDGQVERFNVRVTMSFTYHAEGAK